ncbi:hypothetical protein [Vannielia sp.]|uniref:hypothetical protein n=1 Tax=Vannielia sp. TaxID=2813045 RepID=UPI00262BA21C|nr:hypothetical protein [Vannielia sp.]MDF1871135.1 hypothetical protein [Vannielia sp.]
MHDTLTAKPYRLVWFQHFHKAGGSSVIAEAGLNGERFYPRHYNGNPVDENGWEIPIWRMDEAEQRAFVDHCETLGVTFVATEWGSQIYPALRDDPRVFSLTFLRDPWDRLVSNYRYAMARGNAPATPIDQFFPHHSLMFRQPEYYTRMLAGGLGVCKAGDAALAAAAGEALAAIDFRADLYNKNAFQALCHRLGWTNHAVVSNKTPGLAMGALQQAARGDFGFLYRNIKLRSEQWNGIKAFRPRFEEMNPLDRALFDGLEESC